MDGENRQGGSRMNFSRVKNFIIVLLIAINIALGCICIVINYQKSYISEEETVLAKEHLNNIGIKIDFQKDGRKKYSLPIYTFEKEEETEISKIYIKTAEEFFDSNISDNEFVTTPDGFSVSVKNDNGALLGTAYLQIEEMLFECQKEGKITSTDKEIIKKSYYAANLKNTENKQIQSKAEKFISRVVHDNEINYKAIAISEYNGGHIVYFSGVVSNTNVVDFYINLYVKNDEILYFVGNIPSKAPEKAYSSQLLDSVNAIYLLTENENVVSITGSGKSIYVKNEKIVYKLYEYETSKFYLLPSWYIEYSDEENNEYSIMYDAINGEIVTETVGIS